MDMDELIEKTIQDYCEEMGYDEKLTSKLSQIVKRYRGGAVEISDLGIFLNQLESLLGKK